MAKRQRGFILILLSLISLFLFLILLTRLSSLFVFHLDANASILASNYQNSFLISLSKLISYVFEPVIIGIVILFLSVFFWLKGLKKFSVFFVLAGALGGAFIYIVKDIVQRPRPLNMLLPETGFSFPSGHATISVIFFGFLIYLAITRLKSTKVKTSLTVIAILLVLIIGLSRVYLHVHWLSDVIGGFLLGMFFLFGLLSLKRHI